MAIDKAIKGVGLQGGREDLGMGGSLARVEGWMVWEVWVWGWEVEASSGALRRFAQLAPGWLARSRRRGGTGRAGGARSADPR